MTSAVERILARSGPDPDHPGCRVFYGYCNAKGYGLSYRGPDDPPGSRLAHVIMWEAAHGPLAPGQRVRHIVCDNPPCNLVEHLAVGSTADNNEDARRTRRTRARATAGRAALARSMLLAGMDRTTIAARLGVGVPHVRRLLRGEVAAPGDRRY